MAQYLLHMHTESSKKKKKKKVEQYIEHAPNPLEAHKI